MARPAREWKTVKGWNGRYQVSNYGEIYNTETGKEMKANCASGYYTICFSRPGFKKYHAVHRLVLEYFGGKPRNKNKTECNHKDGNKFNNRITNLEWVTHQENMNHDNVKRLTPPGVNASTPEQLEAMRILHLQMPVYKIAKAFNVSTHYVHSIVQK